MKIKLDQIQQDYLGKDWSIDALIARCLALVEENRNLAAAELTGAKVTNTKRGFFLVITVGDGEYRGHGGTELEAVISCFVNLWYHFVTVPNAPEPTEEELAAKAAGQTISVLRSYISRTGESLRVARDRLRI